ncbi:MAG: hypothetical protein B7Z37_28465 [Verrucomicrobia bacterium 12-59-8]|nr:MAG: hypothetical protein B7Z37_28465 [Verrucomicrobia bacterium 12-59-8]
MDYTLQQASAADTIAGRIVPPRSRNLRLGGGRKDSPGWTEQKRRSNRARFDSLRPFIKTGVTIVYPSKAKPEVLKGLNECAREFCKEKELPARSVWEGPGKHQHIALGIEYDAEIERAWKARLQKRWLKNFGVPMPQEAFLWKPEIAPEEIASYLSKTRAKDGVMVKGTWPWLSFNPVWEVGFRRHSSPSEKQRDKSASQYSAEKKRRIHRQPRKKGGNHQSTETSEKEGEIPHSQGASSGTCWGRSYWDAVPVRVHHLPRLL